MSEFLTAPHTHLTTKFGTQSFRRFAITLVLPPSLIKVAYFLPMMTSALLSEVQKSTCPVRVYRRVHCKRHRPNRILPFLPNTLKLTDAQALF